MKAFFESYGALSSLSQSENSLEYQEKIEKEEKKFGLVLSRLSREKQSYGDNLRNLRCLAENICRYPQLLRKHPQNARKFWEAYEQWFPENPGMYAVAEVVKIADAVKTEAFSEKTAAAVAKYIGQEIDTALLKSWESGVWEDIKWLRGSPYLQTAMPLFTLFAKLASVSPWVVEKPQFETRKAEDLQAAPEQFSVSAEALNEILSESGRELRTFFSKFGFFYTVMDSMKECLWKAKEQDECDFLTLLRQSAEVRRPLNFSVLCEGVARYPELLLLPKALEFFRKAFEVYKQAGGLANVRHAAGHRVWIVLWLWQMGNRLGNEELLTMAGHEAEEAVALAVLEEISGDGRLASEIVKNDWNMPNYFSRESYREAQLLKLLRQRMADK